MPTPLPSSSPNPFQIPIVYHENSTHYIVFDLSRTSKPSESSETYAVSNFSRIPFYFEYSYWDLISCPSGYSNPANISLANVWGCWTDLSNTPVCYSIGDETINVTSQ
jgi:hypothetical protein